MFWLRNSIAPILSPSSDATAGSFRPRTFVVNAMRAPSGENDASRDSPSLPPSVPSAATAPPAAGTR